MQRNEFSVHYQPQISLGGREIVGVEALLRWQSPTRGAVSPSEFIPVAESTGLIQTLGEFVLRTACDQTALWSEEGLLPESFVVWVNVSAKQLTAGGVDKLVRSALASAKIPPARLGLEVTETAIVSEGAAGDRAVVELQELHALGVRIAIDDFGTGFSSLAQLRRFPVDMIKVDRSFVQGIEHDMRDEAITTHTVNLAHAIGVLAIAEGVESSGQLDSIHELGCDLAQGYLFAHPTAPDEVTRQLLDQQRGVASTVAT
jgi:EAL domain-containing protein (putative c-di-GMP-specific phosphodiesterase class I)